MGIIHGSVMHGHIEWIKNVLLSIMRRDRVTHLTQASKRSQSQFDSLGGQNIQYTYKGYMYTYKCIHIYYIYLGSANERRRYIVTALIWWAHIVTTAGIKHVPRWI